MKISVLFAACALASAAGAARAEDLTVTDLRCVVAFTAMLNNPAFRDFAGAGIYYYLGRVEGREPSLDLKSALRQTKAGMGSADLITDGQRCSAALKARNEALKTMNPGGVARGAG